MQTATISGIRQEAPQNPTGRDALNDVDLNDFLKLLITELGNQDPLNPMDNTEILAQVSQIREIQSNSELTETLQAVRLGQALATASSLIGRYVQAMTDDGERITGRVQRVSVIDGKPVLHIDGHEVALENIAEILAEASGEPEEGP